ncbi:SCO family protein [Undibacterium cyanobacteriorum]|uniref:SCO family protein n=1 Tax=Undibacterium cyanobacteriorum TaxID=3073561 RepID=A0ABY9RKK9_9BURK|nr:SCO family protein [Undibacterium sp. 20NA77.5]WMW81753.1 SCO family protein [Undibacterium sp. 20NA77.5]
MASSAHTENGSLEQDQLSAQRRRLLTLLWASSLSTPAGLTLLPNYANAQPSSLLYQLPYQWLNDNGQATRLDHFKGKPSILVMSYGACKKVCSTSLMRMEQMQTILDQKKVEANFVIVGLDPVNDKPEDWRAYRKLRKLERENWYFLSGNAGDIKSLASQLGINYWVYHDHIMHDFSITLLDREGNTLKRMTNGGENLENFLQPLSLSTTAANKL